MLGAGCPTRCLTTATAISRRTSSCPTTPLRRSSKTSRGRRLNDSTAVIVAASCGQRIETSRAGVRKNLLIGGDEAAAAFDRLSDQQSIERISMQIREVLQQQRVR